MEHSNCQSCGATDMAQYCAQCGERQLDESQRKLTILFGHMVEEISSIDSKLYRTLKAFFLAPGFLSREHWKGIRRPYMKPFTLFLLFNLAYFLVSPLTDFVLPLDN